MSDPAVSPPVPVAAERDDRFPPGIPFIVGNEGAERFSYYGMRQILYVYLISLFIGYAAESAVSPDQLAEAKVHATQVTHLFMAGVYLFPMIGAILADRLLGKYRVILWVSLVYCAGHGALALAGRAGAMGSVSLAQAAMFTGLILIAVGSGGIKPCVSANVGDQFTARNSHLLTRIFQVFYFTINFGSFFASFLIPLILQRWGAEWAFGVPGLLMGLATLVFWLGRRRFIQAPPRPGGRLGALDFSASSLMAVPLLVFVGIGATAAEHLVNAAMSARLAAIGRALVELAGNYWPYAAGSVAAFAAGLGFFSLRQRLTEDGGFLSVLTYSLRHRGERRPGEDFWAPARRHFGDEAAEGPPAVLRIIVVFSMVSVFWALFDQHASTWVEQAKAMNRTLVVPGILWSYWLVPAVVAAALYGAWWLYRWVSNQTLPPSATRWFFLTLGAWGAVAAVAQLLSGDQLRITLLAAQISALNPLMVMIIIPLLNVLVYVPLERRGRPLRPLRRMTIGMFISASAFVAVALLQMWIQTAGPGHVHVLWQIIPYFLMTTAEVLVSVTGLEFAYTQAPRAMKSTIMGFWLLCVTFGDVLVAFLAPLQMLSLSTFFWVFAALMAAAAAVFLVLASRYRGKTYLQAA
jgi:proton-dependent oligopeptide transporter, POT family